MGDSSAPRLAPQAYENAFINHPSPKTSHSTLQARLTSASKLNDSLADVFKERAAIEQTYVAALQKLQSKRGAGGGVGGAGGRGEMGGLGAVWERVWGEVNETAAVHTQLEKKMRDEVEGPLRRMSSKGDWAKLSMFDGNLEKTIKHLESSQSRFQKAQKKVDSSRKEKTMAELSESQAAVNDAQQGWLIESPQVFSLYQAIDEGRLTEIKEILAKWETSRSDAARREMEGSEGAMMTILGWDTMEDLQEFLLKKGQSGGQGARAPPSVNGGRNVSGVSNISAMSRTPTVVRRSSVTSGGGSNHDFNPSGSSSNLGGSSLNPLKSVFGRNRNRAGSTASRSGQNGPTRPGNNSQDSYGGAAGAGGFGALGDGDDEPEQPARRREMSDGSGAVETLEPVRENGRQTNGASSTSAPTVDADGFSVPPPDHDKKPWEMDANNASLMDDDTDMHSSQPSEIPQLRLAMAPAPIQESEEERQAALARVQSTLLAQPPSAGSGPTRRGTIARGRRDVRNTMFGGVPDDMPLGQAMAMGAFGKPTSTSRNGSIQETDGAAASSSPSSAFGASPTSTFAPALPTFPSSGHVTTNNTLAASPVSYTGSQPPNPERSNTMMSASSLSGHPPISHNPFDSNPSLATSPSTSSADAPGTLRAAITETCNVVAQQGNILKAMVAGEISCLVPSSAPSSTTGGEKIHLRLDNFEQLLKIAPNPQFVVPAGANHPPGEYLLDPVALAASSAPGGRVVLFKYQLHIGEGKAANLVPVVAVPQWKCEDDSTKLLINYSLSPSAATQATVEGVEFSVPISSPSGPSKPQSKPHPGAWDPATKRITYPADPLSSSGAKEAKVVARMTVEERSVPGPIAVRWVMKGGLCSGLGVRVVGGGEDLGEFGGASGGQAGWKLSEEVLRSVVSGKFTVE